MTDTGPCNAFYKLNENEPKLNENEPKIKSFEYPQEFIGRLKKEFPNNNTFDHYIDGNLSGLLHQFAEFKKNEYDIIRAFEEGEQNKLLEEAKRSDRISKLAREAFAIELKQLFP